MPFPLAPLSLVTLGAAAVFGGTQVYKARKAKKNGDTSAFAEREDQPVGVKMESPYADDAELPGSEADRKDPPKAPRSPSKAAGKSSTKVKSRAPEVPEAA